MDRIVITTAADLTEALGSVAPTTPGTAALAGLPEPQVVDEPNYQGDLEARLADYSARMVAAGFDAPDILDLESAPERILLEEATYRSMLLTQRINAAYRAGLLYFASGADLDHAAELSGVTRLDGESDAALRTRVRVSNRGSSAAGPIDWWRAHALAADAAVEDVAVTRPSYPVPAPGEVRGTLTVSVLSTGVDGAPTPETLSAVEAALTSPAVRGAATVIRVQSATQTVVDISADIWLTEDAPASAVDNLPSALATAWSQSRGLGWSVRESWLVAQLMQPGVARVELVGWADVEMAASEAPRLGIITLTHRLT